MLGIKWLLFTVLRNNMIHVQNKLNEKNMFNLFFNVQYEKQLSS